MAFQPLVLNAYFNVNHTIFKSTFSAHDLIYVPFEVLIDKTMMPWVTWSSQLGPKMEPHDDHLMLVGNLALCHPTPQIQTINACLGMPTPPYLIILEELGNHE